MDGGEPDLQEWRQRYYEQLEQLEKKEREWREVEDLLRQCVSRLTLAADTSDRSLTRQLDRLRESIRQGCPSTAIGETMDSLSQNIVRLDGLRTLRQSVPAPRELLLELIAGLPFPPGLDVKVAALRRNLEETPEGEDHQPLVREFLDLVRESFVPPAGVRGDAASGVLTKLFSRGDKQNADIPREAAPAPQPDLALAQELLSNMIAHLVGPEPVAATYSRRVSAAQAGAELRALSNELLKLLDERGPLSRGGEGETLPIHEVLLRLLERLSIPPDLNEAVERLKASLAGGLPPEQLDGTLSAIADLVAEMRKRVQGEKRDIEDFLKQLTENLKDLDRNLQATVLTHTESFREGRALDVAMHAQVKGIEDSVQQANDLRTLQSDIQTRISTIRGHLEVFREAEEARLLRAESEVKALTSRLNSLETEAGKLRDCILKERSQALLDPLTGIHNRLAYDERMTQEFARWKRYGSSLALVVWDVDRFKSVNDRYGHQAGDKVLRVVAKLLAGQMRETDFVARYGGEEFVALLPETTLEAACAVAEKLRMIVENTDFHHQKTPVEITISCGIARFREGDTPDSVFSRADAALYKAKEAGRNQCKCDGEDRV